MNFAFLASDYDDSEFRKLSILSQFSPDIHRVFRVPSRIFPFDD